MPNRLASETSPYLLQHKDNPVDWYPWGSEAFERAATEDKPVLLSVGYSSCHWCHVMAHESFENASIAAQMNRDFVNIKVDREERPDIDSVYMTAVQAMTGQGGWPMTVFLTPDGKPFYAGTYFPPQDGYGRPGFPRLLEAIHEKWITDREDLVASASDIAERLAEAANRSAGGPASVPPEAFEQAVQLLQQSFDADWGGFGTAPKFPSPSTLEFLLAAHAAGYRGATDGPSPLDMVLDTLRAMASGGMYDQLGGGFARYSVDRQWLIPHFEKMLYDNAQLVRVYLHAFQLTGEPLFERIVRETLAYLEREMRDPAGGFYSAQDADSEGIEGKYYVWTVDEVEQLLGEDAPVFLAWGGLTRDGNFSDPHHPELTGRSALTDRTDYAALAHEFGGTEAEMRTRIDTLRARLLSERSKRVPPGLDDKVLASWNGLALAAVAEAARVLGDIRYRELAESLADFIRREMSDDGKLLHSYRAGRATINGMLEDYAYVGLGLVELFKLTGSLDALQSAEELLLTIRDEFHDADHGGFFESPASGEALLFRNKAFFDAATPSG
ncbi:MAG TPA: thioredoxin domain-containing protein, partial [Tepidiformaceae bacterium]|nr:thioredoxin domain-containing protein [Tepidiformaceae bacterium]